MNNTLDCDVHVMHTVSMKTLAEYIKASGKTDAWLAEKVGCDRSTITKIKLRQTAPSFRLAMAISKVTKVPFESLAPVAPASPTPHTESQA